MGILFLPAARQGRCSGLLFCSAVRPLLLLRLRLRLIPTSDTDTLVVTEASVATVDTEDMVLATPALDTLDLATLVGTDSVTVVTTASARLRLSPRLMLMLRLIPTLDTDTLVATPALDTLVDTEDMVLDTLVDTEDMVLDTLVDTTASARLRLSPRLMLMLMLRLIPTSDTDTVVATDSATEVTPVDTVTLVAT